MKKRITFTLTSIIILTIAFSAFLLTQKVDRQKAQSIALEQAGGGEIIAEEVSKELLWNEYSYTIQNADQWYEIEIGAFGYIEEIESGTGEGWKY